MASSSPVSRIVERCGGSHSRTSAVDRAAEREEPHLGRVAHALAEAAGRDPLDADDVPVPVGQPPRIRDHLPDRLGRGLDDHVELDPGHAGAHRPRRPPAPPHDGRGTDPDQGGVRGFDARELARSGWPNRRPRRARPRPRPARVPGSWPPSSPGRATTTAGRPATRRPERATARRGRASPTAPRRTLARRRSAHRTGSTIGPSPRPERERAVPARRRGRRGSARARPANGDSPARAARKRSTPSSASPQSPQALVTRPDSTIAERSSRISANTRPGGVHASGTWCASTA